MQLIMFDIDGTLTQSNQLDDFAFVQALLDVFNLSVINPDWSTFTHVTDSWIVREIYRTHFGSLPSEQEVERFRHHLMIRLRTAVTKIGSIKPIPGAVEVLKWLRTQPNFAVAYAGGAWTDSALLKLQSAGLPYEDIPYAFADDGYTREEICEIALKRAQAHYQQDFSHAIYIGDGVWDVRTSRNLGYPLIAIAYESNPMQLIAEGAKSVLDDFQDLNQFIALLNEVTQSQDTFQA
ncbi:MAG: HAD hydrolase-like protein [Aulosira sp. DedQUE10]|nr:HAD hydrolase-like protein [Aulosira sp. DedQUE10]